jgi:hypothetical protein
MAGKPPRAELREHKHTRTIESAQMDQLVLPATMALAIKIIRRKNHSKILEMDQSSDETCSLNAHKRRNKRGSKSAEVDH